MLSFTMQPLPIRDEHKKIAFRQFALFFFEQMLNAIFLHYLVYFLKDVLCVKIPILFVIILTQDLK